MKGSSGRCQAAPVSTAPRCRNTYADYLRLQDESTLKLEFSAGEIFAMAGGTPDHGALAMQIVRLATGLPSPCRFLSSDVRIRVEATDLATYPDLSIVCGPTAAAANDPHAVTNPRVLFDVTSPSTEDHDRGDKLAQYKQLPSLEAAVIVSHRRREITVVRREAGGWSEKLVRSGEVFALMEGVSFEVDALYAVAEKVA